MNKVIFHVEKKSHDNLKTKEAKKDKINQDKLLKEENPKQDHSKKIQNIEKKQENSNLNSEQKKKSIREIQQFFQQRYIGSRKNAKIADLHKLTKTPLFNPQVSTEIYKMKTPNLNTKLKQIEKIFGVQKKAHLLNRKKILVENQHLSDLELYLTKRDVLKEKNESLGKLKKIWQEEKLKAEEKKVKRKTKHVRKQEQLQQEIKKEQNPDSIEQKQVQQENKEQQVIKSQSQQLKNEEKTKDLQQSARANSSSLIQMSNDEYFQKKFEQQIAKNSFSKQQRTSIRSMLQTSNNRKTTINTQQYFKSELDAIENVAKSTIDHYHLKQKINKIIYSQVTQPEEDHRSAFMSQRGTPMIQQKEPTQKKSIDWVLKECQIFKKTFNVRKTKSLSNIKKKP